MSVARPLAPTLVEFESHDGALVARHGDYAVLAHGGETRIESTRGALIGLGNTRATRGAHALGASGVGRRDAHGQLVRALGAALVEHVELGPLGIEQSWSLAQRPSGSGDLRVIVPVSRGRYRGSDDRGLTFTDEGGEVLYSHATFVDASGTRTHIPARFLDGTIEMRIESSVLDGARYPAVLDPTITMLSTLGAVGAGPYPAFGSQRRSSFSRFTDTLGLVVYVDLADPTVATFDATRIDETGAPVGSTFRIASGVADAPTELACSSTTCLAVFMAGGSLVGARVDASGVVLDATPVVVAPVGWLGSLAIDVDATGFRVAWAELGTPSGTNATLWSRRVAFDGTLVEANPTAMGAASGAANLTMATLAGTTLIVWDDVLGTTGRLQGVRFDATGVLLDAVPVTVLDSGAVAETMPRIVARAADFLLVYRASGSWMGAALAVTPAITLGATQELRYVGYSNPTSKVALSHDGAVSEMVFVEGSDLGLVRATIPVSLAGLTFEQIALRTTSIDTLDMRSMAGGRVIVSSLVRDYTLGLDTNGHDVQSFTNSANARNLTQGASSARAPAALYAPSQFAVAYLLDQAYTGSKIGVARYAPNGAPSTPFFVDGVSNASLQEGYQAIDPTFVGSNYLLVFQRRQRTFSSSYPTFYLESASLDRGNPGTLGVLRQFSQVYIPYGLIGGPSLATMWNGATYDIARTQITASTQLTWGYVAKPGTPTSVRADGNRAIAWSPTGFVALTTDITPGTTVSSTITDDGGLGIGDGTRSVLVVRRSGPGATATSIYATLLNLAGTSVLKSTFVVSAGADLVGQPRVAFDGTYFDVFFTRGTALSLVRVDEDGTVRDPLPSVVATNVSGSVRAPAVATDRAGKVLVAYETYDSTPGVRAMRVASQIIDWNGTGSGATNGTACTSVLQCASGQCVDGVCCDTACGFGVANDCQACSAAAHGTAANGTCGPSDSTILCRATAGVCDPAESCSGTSTTCPADARAPAGTICGALSSAPCETDQVCNGSSVACQPKAPALNSVVCRPSAGVCDVAETCTGLSTVCPVDSRASTQTVCRPTSGACDRDDRCDGVGSACPPDAPALAGVPCRPAALACDAVEVCDGSTFVCPPDAAAVIGTPCRAATGACDVPEACDGAAFDCPVDAFVPATQTCRAAIGPCDLAEHCTGLGAQCPAADSRKPAGTVCRASVGVCDPAEVCDGAAGICPSDAFAAVGSICRPAAGICDSAETCSGASAPCPRDRARIDGSSCSDGLACTGEETCRAGECAAGEPLVCEIGSVCLEAAGACAPRTRPGGTPGCSVVSTPGAAGTANWPDFAMLAAFGALAFALVRRRGRLLDA